MDIHNTKINGNIEINNVGITKYQLPVIFSSEKEYHTNASFISGVSVKANKKGAHISRIIEILDENFANKTFTIKSINKILEYLSEKVESDNISLNIKFDLTLDTITPVTNKKTYITSNIILNGLYNFGNISKSISLNGAGVALCPNSKSISANGAHSQRAIATVTLHGDIDNIIIENIIPIIRNEFSAEVYGIIKKEDEKLLTEKAYQNPKFSEDIIRNILINLREYYKNGLIEAEVELLESIHEHNVFAKGMLK